MGIGLADVEQSVHERLQAPRVALDNFQVGSEWSGILLEARMRSSGPTISVSGARNA